MRLALPGQAGSWEIFWAGKGKGRSSKHPVPARICHPTQLDPARVWSSAFRRFEPNPAPNRVNAELQAKCPLTSGQCQAWIQGAPYVTAMRKFFLAAPRCPETIPLS